MCEWVCVSKAAVVVIGQIFAVVPTCSALNTPGRAHTRLTPHTNSTLTNLHTSYTLREREREGERERVKDPAWLIFSSGSTEGYIWSITLLRA